VRRCARALRPRRPVPARDSTARCSLAHAPSASAPATKSAYREGWVTNRCRVMMHILEERSVRHSLGCRGSWEKVSRRDASRRCRSMRGRVTSEILGATRGRGSEWASTQGVSAGMGPGRSINPAARRVARAGVHPRRLRCAPAR
jgi:hypothetical protein